MKELLRKLYTKQTKDAQTETGHKTKKTEIGHKTKTSFIVAPPSFSVIMHASMMCVSALMPTCIQRQ